MSEDPRLNAARYRAAQAAREFGEEPEPEQSHENDVGAASPPRAPTEAERAAYVETAIQQAMRRGDFDNLPGAGKPLEGLGDHHDPDWWIRRKIQTEQLTGLGPPAIMLRTEHAAFDDHVDALNREHDVREYIEDFNRRVIEARRQLLGGPPVVTPTHDVDAEVAAWRERRAARAEAARPPASDRSNARRRWWIRAR